MLATTPKYSSGAGRQVLMLGDRSWTPSAGPLAQHVERVKGSPEQFLGVRDKPKD
jgi:hypothetical protein